ncbi:DNA helicase/exodeoxyribonuclease V, alpha subunit [Pasteurella testudinis DSM 23072]|uniref:RecBCD enzyme subunit RecD n=1 Tax=Pasteurella testudinis DSM 23072 TaxID=1122938 RepID=A0A1W1UXC2_9PAST|nr:exodeoxyribonuclease V subunit alpha [Pasteurella testudinis]SMB85384.1 DNA helicase/exodeoxyribonuclease V, alpha subunit [Pasteurella testudinis DSM 23072]SUB51287.1 exodeoxyribonuclease V subunit alpha [Pasteurella testudinis]
MLAILHQLKQAGAISRLDYQFARLIAQKQQPYAYPQPIADLALLLAALLSYHSQNGSSCLDPQDFRHGDFFDLAMQSELRPLLQQIRQRINGIEPQQWQTVLQQHIAFGSQTQQPTPLFWSHGLLYLYRNWFDEQQVAQHLLARLRQPTVRLADQPLAVLLDLLFPSIDQEINWQKIAVATALRHNFSLISGGPGTGKTRTVCSLLCALQWQQQQLQGEPLKIALVAPTGKAAARLSESISNSVQQLPSAIDPRLKQQIPNKAQTLHRLLGVNPQRRQLRYHQANPLPFDLLVVDEASMIDLNLFAQLLNALAPQTRLVLLGDKDQLASVEAGAVMAQLCRFLAQGYSREHCDYLQQVSGQVLEAAANGNPIRDCLCFLRKSYRFDQHSGIKALAEAVNHGRADGWKLFIRQADLTLYRYPLEELENGTDSGNRTFNPTLAALDLILKQAVTWYADYLQAIDQLDDFSAESLKPIFNAFNRVRLLSGLRSGEFGVEQLNIAISERLRQKGGLHFRHWHEWYHGKPIMVLQNDSAVELYNGDIGLFLTDKQGNSRVCFEVGQGQYRDLSPSRVPPHEAAFVMTVHKSQGSEFDHTVLILPLSMSPVLSRELLYTAVTRAKSHFSLFASSRVWQSAVQKPILRGSGLYGLLQENSL